MFVCHNKLCINFVGFSVFFNQHGVKTVITLYPKRQNKDINEMYNLYIYLTSNSQTMKKFSSLPLKSPCENVLNRLYHVFST